MYDNEGLFLRRMDDLRIYVPPYSVSTISGRLVDDNEGLCTMEPSVRLIRFPPRAGLKPGTARSAGHR